MTQSMEKIEASAAPAAAPAQRTAPETPGTPGKPVSGAGKPTWWRRPWIIPLMAVIAGYLVYQLKPFIGVDPSLAPVPPHPGFPAYYGVLVVHITCGPIAMVTVIFQIWPWFRRHHAKAHRVMGRIYVAAVVLTGLSGLTIVRFAPAVGQIGVVMVTLTLLATTIAGFVMARRGKYVEHRRLMLYSFALVTNNIWGVTIVEVLLHLPITVQLSYLLEAARWIGWVLNLMLVQWWLYHTAGRALDLPLRTRRRAGVATAPAAESVGADA
jgi:uncharacterized membrane protein